MSNQDRIFPKTVALFDLLIGTFLFIATAGFVFWQNAHLTVLWDLSYILENATRISLGQMPYRDFPFPYAPLTFMVQAAIIKLFGRVVLHHYIYASLSAGAATVLTWRILLRLLSGTRLPIRLTACLLAAPLMFLGTSSILPIPFYDSDCTLLILFCVWLLLRIERGEYPALALFGGGVLLAVPLFIKQNTGLVFLVSAFVCIAWLAIRKRRAIFWCLAGTAVGVTLGVVAIQCTAGLRNYIHWTVEFAASRRLPGLSTMLGVYEDRALIWEFVAFGLGAGIWFLIPHIRQKRADAGHPLLQGHPIFEWLRWVSCGLMGLPFVWALAALFVEDNASDRVEALLHLWPELLAASLVFAVWRLWKAESVADLVPLMLLGTVHGAFLSQQLWGSTYALWPLLMILIATVVATLSQTDEDGHGRRPLMAYVTLVSLVLLVTGGYYALSHERLEYVDLSGDTLRHSEIPALRGVAMRGSWLPDFEELVSYSNREIPREDAILMVPGEDLFYFTTGRWPQFPVAMMDNTVNPYSAAQIEQLVHERNVRWLVVKRNLQLKEEPLAFRSQLMKLLSRDFEMHESLNNYDVYRRKSE